MITRDEYAIVAKRLRLEFFGNDNRDWKDGFNRAVEIFAEVCQMGSRKYVEMPFLEYCGLVKGGSPVIVTDAPRFLDGQGTEEVSVLGRTKDGRYFRLVRVLPSRKEWQEERYQSRGHEVHDLSSWHVRMTEGAFSNKFSVLERVIPE